MNEKPQRERLFELMQVIADKAIKDHKPKGRSLYSFEFDEGAYKGGWNFKLNHQNLTPLNILRILDEVNWPAFSTLVDEANIILMKLLEERFATKLKELKQ